MKVRGYFVLGAALVLCGASSVQAADGVVLIDQNRAFAGNVTPGDAPGFPVTISQPGSYRLSGNLAVPANTDGILIAADDVTLDLNGFRIVGSGSGTGVSNGVVARRGTAIRNGTIRNFLDGINLAQTAPFASSEILQIRALENLRDGISVGDNAIVSGNTVVGNAATGLSAGQNSTISGNTASRNHNGLLASLGSILSGNAVSRNTNVGIIVECPSALVGNTAQLNFSSDLIDIGSNTCTFANNNPATP